MAKMLERPVFYDRHNGRRWLWIKSGLAALLGGVVLLGCLVVPGILALEPLPGQPAASSAEIAPSRLATRINQFNVPVIGEGPLARVVQIRHHGQNATAVPVYGRFPAGALTHDEALATRGYNYAIERYGQVPGKMVALTFDDGPDPTWTPRVLDVLAKHHVPATFFEIGQQIVKYPAITQRVAREGHSLGNHTFTHINFDTVGDTMAAQELNQTQRVIRSVTGQRTALVRLPYGGNNDQSLRDFVRGILVAQQQGYTVAYYQFDSNDWEFGQGVQPTLPKFGGQSIVALLHDGGGDRSRTLPYLDQFITTAQQHGYHFVTLDGMYRSRQLTAPAAVTTADRAAFYAAAAYLVWPHRLVSKLFLVTIAAALLTMLLNVVLAALRIRRTRFKRRRAGYYPLVSVVVPAYNEASVLAKTIASLRRSRYRNYEIIIVDDGSSDGTWAAAQALVSCPRVLAFHKANGGKAAALNYGVRKAAGEIIVGVDADTIFLPNTLDRLVRHFANGQVGAVAGAVKVGNTRNPLGRWQALDYTIGIYVERNAQALLGAVMIVPGACGAWRKSALLAAGGYSAMTLAEDFDMTLALHQRGYRIVQDNSAVAYTEAPLSLVSLYRQRYRWIFGNIQSFWKHRSLLFGRRPSWLGWFTMPLAMFNLVAPLLFGPLLLAVELENIAAGNYEIVLLFLAATLALQVLFAAVALRLAGESWRFLLVAPLTRLLYGPLRSLILYRCLVHVARGSLEGWNKLQRTATVEERRVLRTS